MTDPNYKLRMKAIKTIQGLYPADSNDEETRNIGQMLLKQARKNVIVAWEDEPTSVLVHYALLCREFHNERFEEESNIAEKDL